MVFAFDCDRCCAMVFVLHNNAGGLFDQHALWLFLYIQG